MELIIFLHFWMPVCTLQAREIQTSNANNKQPLLIYNELKRN